MARVLTPEQRAHKTQQQKAQRAASPLTPEQREHKRATEKAWREALSVEQKTALNARETAWSQDRRARLPLEGPSIRMYHLFRRTLEDYDRVLIEQGGGCAACGVPPGAKRLCWDHDHACCPGKKTCGKCVRGLVCVPCNVRIGYLETDNAPQLAYIEKWKT